LRSGRDTGKSRGTDTKGYHIGNGSVGRKEEPMTNDSLKKIKECPGEKGVGKEGKSRKEQKSRLHRRRNEQGTALGLIRGGKGRRGWDEGGGRKWGGGGTGGGGSHNGGIRGGRGKGIRGGKKKIQTKRREC